MILKASPFFVEDLIRRAVEAAPIIAAHRALAEFEPTKSKFRVRSGNVSAITKVLRSLGHDEVRLFPTPKGRTDFLWAAYNHLVKLTDHEELFVALGRRRGDGEHAPSSLEGVWRGVGGRDSVALSPQVQGMIERQILVENGEVIIVHNHPPFDVKSLYSFLFGWKPLPSSADREVALGHNLRAFFSALQNGRGGRLRWYLVDESKLAEFYLPSLERIMDLFGFGDAR